MSLITLKICFADLKVLSGLLFILMNILFYLDGLLHPEVYTNVHSNGHKHFYPNLPFPDNQNV